MTGNVTRIARFSTGTVDIHPQHAYRGRAPVYWWALTSKRWLTGRPINVYVIEHRDGLVVFDTGQDRASVIDPDYFPGGPVGLFYRRLARFDIPEAETFAAGVEALGYGTGDVTHAVVSHLHQDHVGGVAEIPQAELLVGPGEWRSLRRPLPEARGLLRSHIDLPGLRWSPIGFSALAGTTDAERLAPFREAADLFGDGSLVILPTPGHTPGSVSLLVRRTGEAPLLFVGDLTYDVHAFEHGRDGGVGPTRRLAESRRRVLTLKAGHPGLEILAAHDPAAGLVLPSV